MEDNESPKRSRGRPKRGSLLPVAVANKVKEYKDSIDNPKLASLHDAVQYAKENLQNGETFIDQDPDPYGFLQDLENEHQIDVLDPQWKASPDEDLWNKRKTARKRKADVARLFLLGFSIAEIAQRVKTSLYTVSQDIAHITGEWRKSYLDDIEILAGRDLATLDYMFSKLAPAIDRGDTKAVSVAVDIIKQRGEILGYNHGVQVDIEQLLRDAATANGVDPERAVTFAQRIRVSMK